MKQTLSLLVVLMFVLSAVPIALAQDTENTVSGVTGISAVTDETTEETTTEEVEETENEVVTAVVTSAEVENETESSEGVEIEGAEEYSGVEQVLDKVSLWFAWKDEQKEKVMNKIQTKRDAHASFLEAKGKTEQANKFREGTDKLKKKFEEEKEKLKSKFEEKMNKIENKFKERNQTCEKDHCDNITAVKEKVRERIGNKTDKPERINNETAPPEQKEKRENQSGIPRPNGKSDMKNGKGPGPNGMVPPPVNESAEPAEEIGTEED